MPTPDTHIRPLPDKPVLPASFWWLSACVFVLPTVTLMLTMSLQSLGAWVWVVHAGVILLSTLVVWSYYRADLKRLKRKLAHHQFHVCPKCRYPLDTLPEHADRCPECGTINNPAAIRALWEQWERDEKRAPR